VSYWAEKRNWSGDTLQNFEERLKAVVIVPYDSELCRAYGKVQASLPKGVVVAPNDLWIATCAIRHSIPLISNNRKHFEQIPGLKLITLTPSKTVPPSVPGDLFAPAEAQSTASDPPPSANVAKKDTPPRTSE
jgi:PIN domain